MIGTAGMEPPMRGKNRANARNIVIGIAILSASIAIYFLWKERVFDNFTPNGIESFLSRFGNLAPLVYIVLLAVAIVISQIPNVPLAIAAGMLFGPFWGGLYSLVGECWERWPVLRSPGLSGSPSSGRFSDRSLVFPSVAKIITLRCSSSFPG